MSASPRDPWTWPLHRCPTARGDLAYVDSGGDGAPIVLVHGLPTAKELWYPVIPRLLAGDPSLRIIAVDLLGYGESAKPSARVHHREQASALDGLRRHLGLETITLVAHDLGATHAIDVMGAFAAGVSRLVLMSPPVYPDFREPPVVKLLRVPGLGQGLLALGTSLLFTASMHRGLAHPERLTPRLHRAMVSPYRGAEGKAALRRNLWWGRPAEVFAEYPRTIRGIEVPTLILQGCADPYIPMAQVARLHRDIHGSQLRLLADGAHFLPIDTPAEIAAALLKFLRENGDESAPSNASLSA